MRSCRAHGGAAQDGFLHLVLFFQALKDRFAQLVPVQRVDVDAFLLEVDAELRSQLSFEAVHVPLVGMHCFRRVRFHRPR